MDQVQEVGARPQGVWATEKGDEEMRFRYLQIIWCDCKTESIDAKDHQTWCPFKKMGRNE